MTSPRYAARNAILTWLHEEDPEGRGAFDVHILAEAHNGLFQGQTLSYNAFESDIDLAAERLMALGLIRGFESAEYRGPTTAYLTAEGQDCVEQYGGDVERYFSHRDRLAPSIQIGTMHTTGSVAVGSSHFSQNVNMGVDPAALGRFAQMLLSELPNLGLTKQLQSEARTALQAVQQEAEQPQPDTGRIRQLMLRLAGGLADKPDVIVNMIQLAITAGNMS
jgi:hypothetical protein